MTDYQSGDHRAFWPHRVQLFAKEAAMVEMPRQEPFTNALKAAEAPEQNATSAGSRKLKRGLLALALLAGAAGSAFYGYDYWTVGRFLVSTDDAYVTADSTVVAPKVSGYISQVLVEDNQHVRTGQILARIDDRDYRAALDQARADLGAAEAAVRSYDAEIALQRAEIDQATAEVASTRASLNFAQEDAARYRDLMKTGAGTVQRAQQTEAVWASTTAQLARDSAALSSSKRKIDVLTAGRDQAAAQAQRSAAAERQAELNLSYTTITAAVEGTVGARSLRVGQYVTAGTQLMAVVPLQASYVVANFKETQLTDMRRDQPVEVEVDSFPGLKLKARIDSIAPASGLEFSLLPPDNATGNFTKIVQRIPVKIVFDDAEQAKVLRAGMSVEPTVDTRVAPTADRRPAAPVNSRRDIAGSQLSAR
jgi:membrane fusion protein, multidrug efflux system